MDVRERAVAPLLDVPSAPAGVGNMSMILTTAAWGVGVILADGLLGFVSYVPLAWFVLLACTAFVLNGIHNYVLARWQKRTAEEQSRLRASRGLFFSGLGFFIAAMNGGMFRLITSVVQSLGTWTVETFLAQTLFGLFAVLVVMGMLQWRMVANIVSRPV
jgi:hypothetical protein